jgi:hypothetical protein
MRQWLLFASFSTLLLTACGADEPAIPADVVPATPTAATPATLTEAEFVGVSAEIFCLPQKWPGESEEELELVAIGELTKAGITYEEYTDFQVRLATDAAAKAETQLAIVGLADEICGEKGGKTK